MLNERKSKNSTHLNSSVNVQSKRVKMVHFMSCIFCHNKKEYLLCDSFIFMKSLENQKADQLTPGEGDGRTVAQP